MKATPGKGRRGMDDSRNDGDTKITNNSHDFGRGESVKIWKKVLYEDIGFPDNYVDKSFLEEMKKNLYAREYEFWSVVVESGVVSQQMSSVCIFVTLFAYLDQNLLSPTFLFTLVMLLGVAGYALFDLVDGGKERQESGRSRKDDVKTAVLVLGYVFGFSPVLKTLTDSISTDTIYAMTTFMLLLNLLFQDYGASGAIVSKSVSLNASIFATVCLASRLRSAWHAFVTVTFAMQLFALFPALRRKIKTYYRKIHVMLTWSLACLAVAILLPLSRGYAVSIFLLHLSVTFLCPLRLVMLQRQKNNIHGPWDEAEIIE